METNPAVPSRIRCVRLGTLQLFWLQEKCDSQQQLLCERCYPESERHQPGGATWRHLRWFQSCVLRPHHHHRCHQRRSLSSTLSSTKPQTSAVSFHHLAGAGGVDGGDSVAASSELWGVPSSTWLLDIRETEPGSRLSPEPIGSAAVLGGCQSAGTWNREMQGPLLGDLQSQPGCVPSACASLRSSHPVFN